MISVFLQYFCALSPRWPRYRDRMSGYWDVGKSGFLDICISVSGRFGHGDAGKSGYQDIGEKKQIS